MYKKRIYTTIKDARHEEKRLQFEIDQVWLYVHVPAVKRGRTKKLASFWRGLYMVIDRVNAAVDYCIHLVDSTKTLIMYRN